MVNYNIKGTGVEITDELRAYTEKKLQHAEKFLKGNSTVHVDVELEHNAHREGDSNRAEFNLSIGGEVYRAEAWGQTLHAAIDIATDDLGRELGREKKKRLHVLRRSALKIKEYLRGWGPKV